MYIWILIVPIFAKNFYKINNYLTFQVAGQKIEIIFSLPFSWKVFFFSALAFSIANTITLLRCPRIIKEHLSADGFIRDGKKEDHLNEYAKNINIGYQYRREALKFNDTLDLSPEIKNKDFLKSEGEYLTLKFWEIYKQGEIVFPIFRSVTLIFYMVGFILFLWVLSMNIYWVSLFIL
jgi:hypothetical protein